MAGLLAPHEAPDGAPGCAGARHASKKDVVGHGEVPSLRLGAPFNELARGLQPGTLLFRHAPSAISDSSAPGAPLSLQPAHQQGEVGSALVPELYGCICAVVK